MASSRAKSEFIANMSHDIRTPITGLVGMAQDLLYTAKDIRKIIGSEQSLPQQKYKELLQSFIEHTEQNNQVILSSVDELLRLCNEILELARLESGVKKPSPGSFSFWEIIQHNIKLLKPVAKHKKLQLTAKIADDIPTYLHGLYAYLDRILLNLISNALKFTKQGQVSVLASLADSTALASDYKKGDLLKLMIQVKDTGIGIPVDKFDTIFEHFSRLTSSYEGIYKGSGLGLYTVKKYVEAMGGQIAVESEIEKGTCFTLILPFVIDDHPDVSSKEQLSFVPTISSESAVREDIKKSDVFILLVEDNKAAAIAVSMGLKRLHCQVDIAATGLEGVERARQKPYDLILMDVGLPDIDGLEATRRIRALPTDQYKQSPIVALTGHITEDKHADCIDSGMNDVITKPAPPLMLESLLKRFVWQFGPDENLAEKQSDQSTQNDEPAIDWEGCVSAVGADPDVAKQLLGICSNELKTTKQILEEGYQKKDLEKLRAELHKCLGGVVYLRLPRIETGLRAFQVVVHDEPGNAKKFSAAYRELQDAIQAYQKQWSVLSKEK